MIDPSAANAADGGNGDDGPIRVAHFGHGPSAWVRWLFKGRSRPPAEWHAVSKVFTCIALAWVHLFIVAWIGSISQADWAVSISLIIPAGFTSVAFPIARRKWWRWLVLAFLALTALPPAGTIILLVGESWLWYRSWFVEFHTMAAPAPFRIRERLGSLSPRQAIKRRRSAA